MPVTILVRVLLALALSSLPVVPAAAKDDLSARPVRVIVGYPPGGVNDILARAIGHALAKPLGTAVVVENRPGANGIVGAEVVAKSAPDGQTLFFTGTPFAINASLYPKLPYDTLRDFAPVSVVSTGTFVLVVNPTLPVTNARELIEYTRANPGKVSFCSSGSGSPAHLMGELVKQTAKIDMLHVPYKGVAPCITDLLGGQVQVAFEAMAPLLPHIRSGKLRALAVMGEERSAVLPELPTIAEATALSGLTSPTWYAVLAPAKTPPETIERLNRALGEVLRSPEVRTSLSAQGLEPRPSTPAELQKLMEGEVAKWASVVKQSGARVD